MTATMPKQKHEGYLDFLDVCDFVDNDQNQARLAAFGNEHFPDRKHPERQFLWVAAGIGDSDEDEAGGLVDVLVREVIGRYESERRIIVTAERVQDVVAVWRQLKTQLTQGMPVLLYHGRLTQKQRKRVYQNLLEIEKDGSGYVLVSTSAIEVGCDLDAHCLITQLCDPHRLIQRAGRCNRRQKMADAQVITVGDTIPDWLTVLKPEELEHYLIELKRQNGSLLKPAPLLACLTAEPKTDYRVEMMFDMLYEYVYEARLENKPFHEKGLIITRSWEPSLMIATEIDDRGRTQNAIEVPMRSCKARDDEPLATDWCVSKVQFDDRENRYVERNLASWECAYSVDVVAYPLNSWLFDFDEEVGWVDLPAIFDRSFPSGPRRVLERSEDDKKRRLWYIAESVKPTSDSGSKTTELLGGDE